MPHPLIYSFFGTNTMQQNPVTIGNITINQSENGLYLLTDLWKASGGLKKDQPNNWLKLENTKSIISYYKSQDSRSEKKSSYFLTINGGDTKKQGTYVCKQLVYSYAMWISPAFHDLVITTFDDLLNATTSEQVSAVKFKLDNESQADLFTKAQQPRDKNTLQVILKCTPFQAEQFHNELICDGMLEKIGSKTITQRILGTTIKNKMVTGKKGDTLLWDTNALKNYFDGKQKDWTK